MTGESSPPFAQLRQRMADWLANFRPTPRTYITAACVGAAVGQYAALAGSADPLVAVTTLGAQLGVNLLADIIGSRPAPSTLTVDQITEALQTRMEAGDDLPAVSALIHKFDLIHLAMEAWEGAEDERYQKLLTELKAHPKLVATEVVDALGPRLTGIEQTTGEVLRIVQQTSQPGGANAQLSAGESQLPPQIAPNPFGDVGRLTDPARFWNRKDLLRRIFEELEKGVNLSLVGESQIGKSSLLSMICHDGPNRISRPVDKFEYLDLRSMRDKDEFYEMLCEVLTVGLCQGKDLTRALRGKHFIICLDEIEKIGADHLGFTVEMRSELAGLADGADAPLTLVTAGRSPLSTLFPDSPVHTSPLYSFFLQIDVPPFSYPDARAFLDRRLASTGIIFTPADIDSLLAQSGGHPGRLQRAAADLYRRLTQLA